MSDAHEHNYYEVALSHRQVVWVLVVLLGCVVAAFLAGIWIGQQQTAPAVAMVEAQTEPRLPERQGRQLEDLNFFNEERAEPRTEPRPAVTPGPGTTLADDLASDGTPPSAPSARTPRQPEAGQAAMAEAGPPPTDSPAVPEAAPPPGEGLVIQVFSSPDRAQATQVVERLRGSGHPAFLSPVDVGGTPMFRVRIGPYAERARAERVAEAVRRAFRLDTWITQNS